MKSTCIVLILISVFSTIVRAQNDTSTLPNCAVQCMTRFIPQSSCSMEDQKCICGDIVLQTNLTACVISNCTVKEGLITQSITAQSCHWPVRDQQPLLRKVTIPFLVFSTMFYATRIIARLPTFGGQFGSDDYMTSAAYILALGFSITMLLLASAGLGKDIWQVPFNDSNDQVTYTLKLFTALEKTYILTIWCTKMSILLLYLRIFPDTNFRLKVRLCLAFCAATAFCLFWACLFKCWPVSYGWTYWDGEHQGSCSSQNAQGWANAGLNIFGDLLVLSLPIHTIWKMSLSKSKRLGIIFMFGVGIFITIVSIVRLYTLKGFSLSTNPTWDFVNLSLWSVLEVDVGIMCACLPGTRNFYSRVVYGRILKRGPFAPAGFRPDSAGSTRPPMAQNHYQQCYRTTSAASNSSDATTLNGNTVTFSKQFILVVNDIDIEARSTASAEKNNVYMVEEWPMRCDV